METCTPPGSPTKRVLKPTDEPDVHTPPLVLIEVSNGINKLPDNNLLDENDLGSKNTAKKLENGAMFKEKKFKKKMKSAIRARDKSSASESDNGGGFGL